MTAPDGCGGAPIFRLLVLGGTTEARELAAALAERPGLHVITSLAGRTARPLRPAGELRVGGFGGIAGLAAWLRARAIDAVIDATHPFADTISANAAAACHQEGVPRLALVRPPWTAAPGDRWEGVVNVEIAAAQVASLGTRPFLTVGRQSLAPFAACRACRFVVRVFEPPTAPLLPGAEIVVSRGPFTMESERALFIDKAIDLLITKNAGGAAGYSKIAAARAMALPVLMIERPPPPPAPNVVDVREALAWVAAQA